MLSSAHIRLPLNFATNTVGVTGLLLALLLQGCSSQELQPWHTAKLKQEFTFAQADEVRTLDDYLALEDRLFAELERKVYDKVETGPNYALFRYSAGSVSDPRDFEPNWNRTFELNPDDARGGVLLLHGMSDSPYSLRALALKLHDQKYRVLGMRMPGHGTAPSSLRRIRPEDMSAAVHIGMAHLADALGDKPIHVVGYSTGATLALDYALDAAERGLVVAPASLVLISPAIRVHSAAALARFKDSVSAVPGLGGMSWLSVDPEFNPYKYNSFATNAGHVVHSLTRSVDSRIAAIAASDNGMLPPILVFKSTVDSTVTTEAVVDNLLGRLAPNRNELVLFDINRSAAKSLILIEDPGPLTYRLMSDKNLPFSVTFVVNENPESDKVVARHKAPFTGVMTELENLEMRWPNGVMSLSHVALPFPPDDPLYGTIRPESPTQIYLGEMAMKGERGLVKLPGDWLLRMRYNPFYEIIEKRVLEWFENIGGEVPQAGAGEPTDQE